MFCTATLGGQIIKIIYEKDNILIFTIRNVKGNKYEYYNIGYWNMKVVMNNFYY